MIKNLTLISVFLNDLYNVLHVEQSVENDPINTPVVDVFEYKEHLPDIPFVSLVQKDESLFIIASMRPICDGILVYFPLSEKTGEMLIVEKSNLTYLDLSYEEAMKIILPK